LASQPYNVFDDKLKTVYADLKRSSDFYEGTGPDVLLYRAQTGDDFLGKKLFLEARVGVDIKVIKVDGQDVVCGCLTEKGNKHWGVSTFDGHVRPTVDHTAMYEIPKNVKLHEGLVITKDKYQPKWKATHYTIAPKNDMTVGLFEQCLKEVAAQCTKIKDAGNG
jgi:hypothetical protein